MDKRDQIRLGIYNEMESPPLDDENIFEKQYYDPDLNHPSPYSLRVVESLNEIEVSNEEYSTEHSFDSISEITEVDVGIVHDAALRTSPNYEPETIKIKEETASENEEIAAEYYNKRALSKHATTYELETFQRKALIIFNQVNFLDGTKPRRGTEKDVAALIKTFELFEFEVVEKTDLNKDEIETELKNFTDRDFTEYGCIAVAVLTHGSDYGELKAKDLTFNEKDIIEHLKIKRNPTLVTKPRVVIIQACRGVEDIAGVRVMAQSIIFHDKLEEREPYTLPVESDMLVMHSSYAGKPSHRTLEGSWFIQTLCTKINELANSQDLETILTEVKRAVAIDKEHEVFNRRTDELDINKQMPVTTSTLIRKLYLKKYNRNITETDNEVNAPTVPSSSWMESLPSRSETSMNDMALHVRYEDVKACLQNYIDRYPEDEEMPQYLNIATSLPYYDDELRLSLLKTASKHLIDKLGAEEYLELLYERK